MVGNVVGCEVGMEVVGAVVGNVVGCEVGMEVVGSEVVGAEVHTPQVAWQLMAMNLNELLVGSQ